MEIYKISFPQTNKVYVGMATKTAKKRLKEHLQLNKKTALTNAIKKYGKESVTLTVLASCDDYELLCFAEQEAISKYNSKFPNGYNLTDGGDGSPGCKYTEEQNKANSERCKEYSKDPENRKANSERQKIAQNDPKVRAKQRKSIMEFYSNPVNRENASIKQKEFMSRPGEKERMSKATRDYFKNNPDAITASSERKKEYFADPENRKAQSIRLKLFAKENPDSYQIGWAKRRKDKDVN